MPSNISIPGAVAIAILVVLVLIVIVRNIYVVQQSKAYVVERLGAFRTVWNVGLHLKVPFIERVAKKVSLKEQVADFAFHSSPDGHFRHKISTTHHHSAPDEKSLSAKRFSVRLRPKNGNAQ